MFHPTSNRLAGFLEISALSIALARSGGWQVKAGLLQIVPSGKGSGFGRKSASTVERKKMRWLCHSRKLFSCRRGSWRGKCSFDVASSAFINSYS